MRKEIHVLKGRTWMKCRSCQRADSVSGVSVPSVSNGKKKSMQSITKDIIFEKCNGKNSNAETWL